MLSLEDILVLEDNLQLEDAFNAYQQLYSAFPNDFLVWKHYYFFLWYTEVESGCLKGSDAFTEKHAISTLLKPTFLEGEKQFSHLAEFNFIAGYTICLFPYYYGEYTEWEGIGRQLLATATKLEPLNPQYKSAHLGSFPVTGLIEEYAYYANLTRTTAWTKYLGKGFLNDYFREMIDKGAVPLT